MLVPTLQGGVRIMAWLGLICWFVWMRDCVDAWKRGCVDVWMRGLCGCVDVRMNGYVEARMCG
jgi:hypothetical protein